MTEDPARTQVVVDGVSYDATYSVDNGAVTVSYLPTGTKTRAAERCRAEVIARVLLLELVRERLNLASRRDFTPMLHTITYDEWLSLSPSEQVLTQRGWVANVGENEHIPTEAARRLRLSSPLPLAKVEIGMFHMGEYILRAIVRSGDLEKAPRSREQVFAGFFVHYESK